MIGKLLSKSLVRIFYRQNAGQLVFIYIVFFGVVAPSQQLHYHHDLIRGMLSAPVLFALVLGAWFLYNEKCAQFVIAGLRSPEYGFLDILNRLDSGKLYSIFWVLQLQLSLPVSSYSVAVIAVACYHHWYMSAITVFGYIVVLCSYNAARFRHSSRNPGRHVLLFANGSWSRNRIRLWGLRWWPFFIRYTLREQKFLLTGIKLFSCGVLYLGVRSMAPGEYDLRMPCLFYGIGLLGHGVLVYRFRDLEEKRLRFYRGLPVSLFRRLTGYALLYLAVLIPEMITLGWLVRGPLHVSDALELLFSGYGFLLLLNSLLFVAPIPARDYMKIVFCLFLLLYFCVLSGILGWLAACTGIVASILFFRQYYRFETGNESF